ncbi:hypothetical protein [Clostridioides sp. ZZV15-6598]|uniref:hypothetical protein n=1 Tax=Clostridioides sp. ZZV15-6598 TaxID=2811501 RepID=UPI001D10914D|nr:hypothetical protein [Clostridioides sp. ZZV15-6598]
MKKISEMSMLEKADFIRNRQIELKKKYQSKSKGELFNIACREIEEKEKRERGVLIARL